MHNNNNNLERFTGAQNDGTYEIAISELLAGKKETHWIWFIFPQLRGLLENESETTTFYGLESRQEVEAYDNDPTLSWRLRTAALALLGHEDKTIGDIMGYPDDLKLQSCMTLFAECTHYTIFQEVLDVFYEGNYCKKTMELLNK